MTAIWCSRCGRPLTRNSAINTRVIVLCHQHADRLPSYLRRPRSQPRRDPAHDRDGPNTTIGRGDYSKAAEWCTESRAVQPPDLVTLYDQMKPPFSCPQMLLRS